MTMIEDIAPAADAPARHDLYTAVHKGIRYAHSRLLVRAGRCDPAVDADVADLAAAVREHLGMCLSHLEHENAEIHTAIESRLPGSSDEAGHDHEDHERSFGEIRALLDSLEAAGPADRAPALARLYRRLVRFVADDLRHMDHEENELQPVLQATFTDEELRDIEHRIVGNIDPGTMALFMRAMLAAATRRDAAEMLTGMRAAMPPEAFDGLMTAVTGRAWTFGDWDALRPAA